MDYNSIKKSRNLKDHYDVGVYGWWCHENFGGCLTYFALHKVLSKMGLSVLMIQEALGYPGRYVIPDDCISMKFARKNYDYFPQVDASELKMLNNVCDNFIIGGDQLWNNNIPFCKEDCFLNFVEDDKRKISFSTSFGSKDHFPPAAFVAQMAPLLRRFDAISVRENYASAIADNIYHAKARQIIDAVFLPEKKDYLEIAQKADCTLPKHYLVAFILNPTAKKRAQIEAIARRLKLEVVCIPDAAAAYHAKFNEIFRGLTILSPLSVENFIKTYAEADYVITDSFHGTCMSYVFKKDFNVYYNEQRGADRFISLMETLQLGERKIDETQTIEQINDNPNIGYNVDWNQATKNVSTEKNSAMKWLKEAIEKIKGTEKYPSEIKNPDAEKLMANQDFKKIRMLVSLLKDYGVKHIVLSPGGRDVPIIRMFEYNDDSFVLHRVTDERSAAYFGLGLAAQLRKPVACVCTSGTAASNYLPAVTEAYYTGIPLIMITADRYGVYLNHGEDQTIPQKNIYDGVIKKSISLPECGGYYAEYQTRRDISDCILEATHNSYGPVHINVPIENISIGSRVPRAYWHVLPFTHPHILRASFLDGKKEMYKWLDCLKRSNRIMLVYGQNAPVDAEQKKYIDLFTKKFNCVVITDHISNFDNEYCIQPYNMLNAISQEVFNNELAPDILITVGGKRLMNDPLTFKVRRCNKGIRHWSVTPDGKVKDFYFKLTSVIESSQSYFFEWFASNAREITNNKEFYSKWHDLNEKYKEYPIVNAFNAHFVQRKLSATLPGNSVLHLGVGQSFYDIRRYSLLKNIEVFCNMGTNGIDGCTSTFMGQCAIEKERLCFLLVGDLSFFYDMNSIWNKELNKNVRIMMINNNGTDLLRGHNLKAVSSVHNTLAEGWVKSNPGFEYISARSPEEFEKELPYFVSKEPKKAVFFEVICD